MIQNEKKDVTRKHYIYRKNADQMITSGHINVNSNMEFTEILPLSRGW